MIKLFEKLFKKRSEKKELIYLPDEEYPYLIYEISDKLDFCHFVFDFNDRYEKFDLHNIKGKTMGVFYPVKNKIVINFWKFTSDDYQYLSPVTVKNITDVFNSKFDLHNTSVSFSISTVNQ